VGGALASLKSYSQIRTSKPNLAEEAARKTDQLLDDVSQDVRRISQDLMPVSLERLGLQAALADIASQLKDHGTEASLEFFGEETNLSDQQTLMVYRIVQELCNNVRKHAEASQVLIQLFIGENHFNLLVEDNGKGFDEQAVSEQKSLGLKTLEARVALLGGTIEIDTRAGTGTSVYIETKVL
jgi:signal transduction histidine kinase